MARTVEQVLNSGDLNRHGAAFNLAKVGSGLKLVPRYVKAAVASHIMVLDDDAKAIGVIAAFATVGTATGGKLPAETDATLAAGEVKANGAGNIEFEATDAVTQAEVWYLAAEGVVFEETIDVTAAGAGTLRSSRTAVVLLEATLGSAASSGGAKTVLPRGATATAGNAALTAPGQVAFNTTDVGASAVTAVVKYVAAPGTNGAETAFGDALDADYPE